MRQEFISQWSESEHPQVMCLILESLRCGMAPSLDVISHRFLISWRCLFTLSRLSMTARVDSLRLDQWFLTPGRVLADA